MTVLLQRRVTGYGEAIPKNARVEEQPAAEVVVA
jgi:hypothetical protein